eukprot:s1511_g3.t1
MAIDVGAEVVIKATKTPGVAKQSNGHACKVGDRWYHMDELEVKPRPVACTAPMKPGAPSGAYPDRPMKAGGSTDARAPSPEDLEVWKRVTSEVNKDLAAKGPPTEVKSQVVAGIKYFFTFADGSCVTVLTVPWMDKVEVLSS